MPRAADAPTAAAPASAGTEIYIVRPGDTLTSIARVYGLTLAHLLSMNQIPNPNLIFPGQEIFVRRDTDEQ